MPFSEEKFRDHIKQVVKQTSHDSDRPLTLDELRQLAESMGVSDREWIKLMAKADDSLMLALGHLKVKNYTDAIQTAEEATSLNPYIKDGNAILAQSYYQLGQVEKNEELYHKAAHYARMELKNDPLDSIALNVLSATEQYRQEGTFSKKLIRTVAMIAGLIVLVFFMLYMCGDGLSNSSAEEIIQEQFDGDKRLTLLKSDANKLRTSYLTAIERRNQDALEVVGFITDSKLKKSFSESITKYDYGHINASEQIYRLELSTVKSKNLLSEELAIRLEGGDNRINTAKKRYSEGVSTYNSLLESSDDLEGDFQPMETLK